MWPNIGHDQRAVAATAQRQTKAIVLAFHCDLGQFRRDAQTVLRYFKSIFVFNDYV